MSITEQFNLAAHGTGALSVLRDHLEAMDELYEYARGLKGQDPISETVNAAAEGKTEPPPVTAVQEAMEMTPEEPMEESDELKYKGGDKAAGSLEGFLDELKKSGF